MSDSSCSKCHGSGFVRCGGYDHSGQVEWNEPCPNGCLSPAAREKPLGVISMAVSVLLFFGFIGFGILVAAK